MMDNKTALSNNPYGQVNFGAFRIKKQAFADKTSFIGFLDDDAMSPYPVLLRPRRFGKSTFVTMLKCFYDISYKNRYRKLFTQTAIYSKKLKSHNTFHVIDFDFSGISGKDENTLVDEFVSAILDGIADFKDRYPDFVFDTNGKKMPSGLFRDFLAAYKQYPSKKSLYVMIDEYDNFANEILSNDQKLFRAITGANGFLKEFYSVIKAGTKNSIAKTFITGVSSVSLDSLTSGFNISRNITSFKDFNGYAGFTEDELLELIPKLVDLKKLGVTEKEIIARMKPVYDGYCFSRFAGQTVYNSSMCLYYLSTMEESNAIPDPEKCPDPAVDYDGKKLKELFNIAEDGLADEIIETYMRGERFYLDNLAENINLNRDADDCAKYSRVQFLFMLYYLEYLTIEPDPVRMAENEADGTGEYNTGEERSGKDITTGDAEAKDKNDSKAGYVDIGRLVLKIPNLFMSKLFSECVVDLRLKKSPVFNENQIDVTALREGKDDLTSFADSCTEFLSGIFTNQVLKELNKMSVNLVLYGKLATESGLFTELQKSLQVPGEGEKFADLTVTVNDGGSRECIYLFELKYMTKTETVEKNGDSMPERLRRDASEQVQMYSRAMCFRNKRVKPYVMIFAGPKCVCCELVKE